MCLANYMLKIDKESGTGEWICFQSNIKKEILNYYPKCHEKISLSLQDLIDFLWDKKVENARKEKNIGKIIWNKEK